MLKYYISENMKIKHTFVKKLTFIAPLAVIILSVLLAARYFVIDMYNWWYVLILPAVIPLICALLSKVDYRMKNKTVLGLPVDLKKVWIAKVLTGVSIIAVSTMIIFIAGVLSVYVIPIKSIFNISAISGFIGALLIIITSIWQVPLYILISRKIGLFPSVIIGIAVSILSVFIAVQNIWWIVPFSYTSRIMCPVLNILPNGLQAIPESITFAPELMDTSTIPFVVGVSITLFIILTLVTAKWYEKQEAK